MQCKQINSLCCARSIFRVVQVMCNMLARAPCVHRLQHLAGAGARPLLTPVPPLPFFSAPSSSTTPPTPSPSLPSLSPPSLLSLSLSLSHTHTPGARSAGRGSPTPARTAPARGGSRRRRAPAALCTKGGLKCERWGKSRGRGGCVGCVGDAHLAPGEYLVAIDEVLEYLVEGVPCSRVSLARTCA